MESYTKLFRGIVHSTVWREPSHVRIVWVTLLALADSRGEVHASVPGLADVARVTLDECCDALDRLRRPDEWSRSPEDGGRRVRDIGGGWLIVNHTKYRDMGGDEAVREYNRKRKADYRAKKGDECPGQVRDNPGQSVDGRASSASASASASKKARPSGARARIGEPDGFPEWYSAYPRKIGRKDAAGAYRKAVAALGELQGPPTLLRGAAQFAEYCRRTGRPVDKTPYPATWLNGESWTDDYPALAEAELQSRQETHHASNRGAAAGDARRAAERARQCPEPVDRPLPHY